MAKVTGPLMSLDASGTVGNTTTFSKWKGRNYVRLRVTPMNTKTDAQAIVRTYLGAFGQALSAVLTKAKDTLHVGSAFWAAAVSFAPAGQSWISYASRTILGTNFGNIEAVVTAYGALSSTPKGYYDTHAATLGLTAFSLSYGTAPAIAAGAQLYGMYKFSVEQLGYAAPAGGFASPTTGELDAFVTYVQVSA
jgi:hypothetical protein